MNKIFLACALVSVTALSACDNKEKSETTVIERETIREVQVEANKDEPTGNSFSISVDEEGSSFKAQANDQ